MDTFDTFDAFGADHQGDLYSGLPDGNGGLDFYHNGQLIDHLAAQGHHTSFTDGTVVHHTANGGEHVFHNGQLEHTTMPNAHGGVDIYDGNMHHEASTMPNEAGGVDIHLVDGNIHDIIHYNDPLAHSNECVFPSCSLD